MISRNCAIVKRLLLCQLIVNDRIDGTYRRILTKWNFCLTFFPVLMHLFVCTRHAAREVAGN